MRPETLYRKKSGLERCSEGRKRHLFRHGKDGYLAKKVDGKMYWVCRTCEKLRPVPKNLVWIGTRVD